MGAEKMSEVHRRLSAQRDGDKSRNTESSPAIPVQIIDLIQAVMHPLTTDKRDLNSILDALILLRRLREELAPWEPKLIAAARELGASWVQLAPALGVASRQAAERRYLRLRPDIAGRVESTGEQRVQAERARRASDRAVITWARNNAAHLRNVASQIAMLQHLSPQAQQSADLIQRALAEDDPSMLLAPLSEVIGYLITINPDLAQRAMDITHHTNQIRKRLNPYLQSSKQVTVSSEDLSPLV
jgi:hypothetical protein